MAPHFDQKTRNTIVRLLFHRCRHKEISKELGVSLSSVKKIEHNLRDYGTPGKPDAKITGRPAIMKPHIIEGLLAKYERTGLEFGQKELKHWLKETYEINVCQSTVSRIISKSGRKKAVAVLAQNKKLAEGENNHSEHVGLVWIGGLPVDGNGPSQSIPHNDLGHSSNHDAQEGRNILSTNQQAPEPSLDPRLST